MAIRAQVEKYYRKYCFALRNSPSRFVLALLLLILTGCKNDEIAPPAPRTIRFELFTNQDFSQDTNSIIFEPSVSVGNTVLWDSVFTSMKVKEIPTEANKIIFEKVIRTNDAELKVGFKYTISNVGTSWYYEKVTTPVDTVTFDFK